MALAVVPLELLLIVLAAVALLLAYGARDLLIKPIAGLLRALPFVGGAIGDAVNGLGDAIASYVEQSFDRQVQAFTDTIDGVSGALQYFADEASKGVVLLFGGLEGLQKAAQGIQRQLQTSISDVASDLGRVARDATRGLAQVQSVAQDLQRAIQTAVPRLIDQAVAGVRTFVRGVERDLQRALDQAVGAVRSWVTGLLASQLDGIRQWVSSLVAQAQRGLQELEADLGRGIRALEHDVGHRLDGLARDLEGLQTQIGVIPLIGLVPWIKSIADTLTKITTECVMPQCRYLGPQLDALEAIQDAATLALVAGAVAYAVRDPVGAAADLEQFMSGADDLARELFRSTTGARV